MQYVGLERAEQGEMSDRWERAERSEDDRPADERAVLDEISAQVRASRGGVRLLSEEKRADRTEVTALTERAVGV
jgi:hypothetical protein